MIDSTESFLQIKAQIQSYLVNQIESAQIESESGLISLLS